MHDEVFRSWRQECEAIEQEMDRLIRGPVPASVEERQVRRIQFAALVERREDAARKLIQADRARLQNIWRKDSSAAGDYFIAAPHFPSTGGAGANTFVKLPDGRSTTDADTAVSNPSTIDASSAADAGDQSIPAGSLLDRADVSEPVVHADTGVPSPQVIADAPSDSRSLHSVSNAIAGGERSSTAEERSVTE
jgi:hypothetical protein